MGQSSSTQREQRHTSPSGYFTSHSLERGENDRDDDMSGRQTTEQTGGFQPSLGTEMGNGGIEALPSGRPHSVSDPWLSSTLSSGVSTPRNLRSIQEHGAPFDLNEREFRSSSFARMASRRQSTMSRLGSRFLPNSVIRGLLSSEEETPAEGLAHRHGMISRSIPRSETAHGSSRFSPFSSLGSRGITRRRSTRGSYLFPRGEPALVSDASNTPYLDAANGHASDSNRGPRRRSARLNRVRNSLSNPISHMFRQSSNTTNQTIRSPETVPDEDHDLRMHFPVVDTHINFDEPLHELDSVEPAVRHTRPLTPIPPQTEAVPFPGFLRARSPRMLRREEQTPLSRVLQLAAAAIAAQLSGTTGPAIPNIQALGNDGLDGSLENFLQTLQQSASTQENNAPSSDRAGVSGSNGPPSPGNFLRVFRFANPDAASDAGGRGVHGDGMDIDNPGEGPDGRTVTLVVVGVRSVPSTNGPDADQQTNGPPGLDALLRMPFLSPGNVQRNRNNEPSAPSRTGRRSRFTTGRHTPTGLNTSPASDAANEPRMYNTSRRPSDSGARSATSSLPTVLSDSPPGPHPPPSTPADPGLSTVSSSTSTPSRRPSSASAMPLNPLPQLHEYQSMHPTVESAEDGVPLNTARQRRRSDSEFARHRDLGSGAVRRNGVVEPDDATPSAGRSWLIYVVGTNLSENHPAFATPSLFTDVSHQEPFFMCCPLIFYRIQPTRI